MEEVGRTAGRRSEPMWGWSLFLSAFGLMGAEGEVWIGLEVRLWWAEG